MSTIKVDTTVTTTNVLTIGTQGPIGPRGPAGDPALIEQLQAQISALSSTKLDAADYIQHFRGFFTSYTNLSTQVPFATDGDYAHIKENEVFGVMEAIWDSTDNMWVISAVNVGSNTDAMPEGSTNLYFKSDRVRQTPMTGISFENNNSVLATDVLLEAIGKLQAQINEMGSDVWNWVHYSEVGIFGSCFAEYFINGIGGLYFCIKDNVLYVKGLITVTTSASTVQNIFVFQNADYYILKPDILNVNLQYFSAQRINLWLTGSLVYEYVKSGATYALKTTSSITAGHVFQILPTALCYVN